jgi:hypothetical protein
MISAKVNNILPTPAWVRVKKINDQKSILMYAVYE